MLNPRDLASDAAALNANRMEDVQKALARGIAWAWK
jgi:hypothetical protein